MATRSIFSSNPAMAQRRIAALKQFLPSLPHSLLGLACVALLCLTYISLRSLTPSNASTPYHSTGSLSFSHASNSQDVEDTKMTASSIYHYPGVFLKNYQAMKNDFKVYIYPDGDPKTYYQTPRKLTGKYCSEGYFFQNIRETHFHTDDPDKADLFFVPISPHKMRGMGTSYENMTIIVRDYVLGLIQKYPYWNRTLGADHFFVACQDVGVRAFEGLEMMVKNSIRVVCSPSYNVGYVPHKDVALPQILQPFALPAGGNDIENRSGLILTHYWAISCVFV